MSLLACLLMCCGLVVLAQARGVPHAKSEAQPEAKTLPEAQKEEHPEVEPMQNDTANTPTIPSPELTSSAGCPRDFVSFALMPNSCYGFIDNDRLPFTWYEASYVCSMYQARLVDYWSADEEMLVVGYYRANVYNAASKHFWIGANDLMKPGSWRWEGSDKAMGYMNWYSRNDGRDKNCAYALYNINFRWYSYFCNHDYVHNAICKTEKKP